MRLPERDIQKDAIVLQDTRDLPFVSPEPYSTPEISEQADLTHIAAGILLDFVGRIPRTAMDHGVQCALVERNINRVASNAGHITDICLPPSDAIELLCLHEIDHGR